MRERIDQLLAGYADGDAISQEARLMRTILHEAGYDSDIFASPAKIAPAVRHDCYSLTDFDAEKCKTVILHYSTSSAASSIFCESHCQRILRYHNITPPEYYAGFDDDVASELIAARKELPAPALAADNCWSCSDYNAQELEKLGVRKSLILPLMFRMNEFETTEDPATLAEFDDGMTNWLFVGRIAPNKRIEELIEAFAWYQQINPSSRLIIVGSVVGCRRYYGMLRLLAARLGLNNICFTGFVSNSTRYTLYRCAHIFVAPSRHEGYCLPLIEAMSRDIPVVARHSGGMPEAMGNGGVSFDNMTPAGLAILIHKICTNSDLHYKIIRSQQQRMQTINSRDLAGELIEYLP
jgi:glycosyltransferase involved in cell wall biosynthesis